MYWYGWQQWNEVHTYECRLCASKVESLHSFSSGSPPECLLGCKWRQKDGDGEMYMDAGLGDEFMDQVEFSVKRWPSLTPAQLESNQFGAARQRLARIWVQTMLDTGKLYLDDNLNLQIPDD